MLSSPSWLLSGVSDYVTVACCCGNCDTKQSCTVPYCCQCYIRLPGEFDIWLQKWYCTVFHCNVLVKLQKWFYCLVMCSSDCRSDFTIELMCLSVASHEFYRCYLVLRYVIVYPFNELLIFFVKIFLVYIEFIPCWWFCLCIHC